MQSISDISTSGIFLNHKYKISFTIMLVIFEGIIEILFPGVIGLTIDQVLSGGLDGLWLLFALGLLLLVVGSLRRFYDTRVYSQIYVTISEQIVQNETKGDVSKTSARANLLNEFITFFEYSLPALIAYGISLFGTLLILLALNLWIFLLCTASAIITLGIYYGSRNSIFQYNQNFNNELEEQVNVITRKDPVSVFEHFKSLAGWKIKLSDLETKNYFAIWLVLILLLCGSIYVLTWTESITAGQILAIIVYVYGFIESIVQLPMFYQEQIRLGEISRRIAN